jgi:hypothetical protein
MCETGTLNMNEMGERSGELVYTAGVIPESSKKKNYCENPFSIDSSIRDCSAYVDQAALYTEIETNCQGQSNCKLNHLARFVQMPDDMPRSDPIWQDCHST